MAAFMKHEFNSLMIAKVERISISDHLTMIDKAYENDDRTTCIEMIEDLYAIFDQAA